MCHPDLPARLVVPDVRTDEVSIPLGDESMPAFRALPESPGPGVLIVSDVFGQTPFYKGLAKRLAGQGYTAVLPDVFFRQGPLPEASYDAAMARRTRLDERRTLDDLAAAADWLAADTGTPGGRVGTVGFCIGGTFALLLAAERDQLATVCFYGFPAGTPPITQASPPSPLSRADELRGPILGLWGELDDKAGIDNVRALAAALEERDVAFEHYVYPGVGHGFLAASGLEPGHDGFEQAEDAWRRVLAFFGRELAGVASAS